MVREEKITLQPMNVIWGRRQVDTITTIADVADALNGDHFTFEVPDSTYAAKKYAPWINTNAGTAPVVAGATLIEVTATTGATAAAVAAAIVSDLNGDATFALDGFASAVGAVVTIKARRPGTVAAPAAATSGFTVAATIVGFGRDLGATSGGVEVGISGEFVDVVTDQTGQQILDKILNATNMEISMTLLELSTENWELLLGQVMGDIVTQSGNDYVGFGDSKRFKNMRQYAGELILKPVGAVGPDDNLHFWKVSPMLDSINYSGTDLAQMEISWNAFRDTDKDSKINMMLHGDGEQFV